MADFVNDIAAIMLDADFNKAIFKPTEVEFRFLAHTVGLDNLGTWLSGLNIEYQLSGKIITANRVSNDKQYRLYAGYEDYFLSVDQEPTLTDTQSAIILNKENTEFFLYNNTSKTETLYKGQPDTPIIKVKNFKAYSSLLHLFFDNAQLVEFNDRVKKRMLVIDNGEKKNVVTLNYELYDPRVFAKTVDFDINYIADRINNTEWISGFKHNVVTLIDSQEDENRNFIEIFLNLKYLLSNTDNDYEIYVQKFSFEKVSTELKAEKQKYFEQLNQAQDKIKSQVISVPLSVGTSVYAFYQLKTDQSTLYFLLLAIGIYIIFIEIYLWLYDKDLRHLKNEIQSDTAKFQTYYPKIFKIFEGDFKYIKSKVRDVTILSNAIKVILVADWLVLLVFVLFFYKHPPEERFFKFI